MMVKEWLSELDREWNEGLPILRGEVERVRVIFCVDDNKRKLARIYFDDGSSEFVTFADSVHERFITEILPLIIDDRRCDRAAEE